MKIFNPYITGSIELDISGSIETNVPWPTSSYSETFNDAPTDGSTYGRKNGTWFAFGGVLGGLYFTNEIYTNPSPASMGTNFEFSATIA